MAKAKEPIVKCGHCGKSAQIVGPLVSTRQNGPLICLGCTREAKSCFDLHPEHLVEAESALRKNHQEFFDDLPSPYKIKSYLDQYIIGQEDVKQVLSIAAVNHYKGIVARLNASTDVELEKSNVLLIGPTGVGKTAMISRLAKSLHVPMAIGDATTLTEAGYVGEDVENLLLKLVHAANGDIQLAEHGIVYIDEIDKIGSTNQNVSISRDVSGSGVQQSLLKLMEGTVSNVSQNAGRKHPEQQYIQVNTTNILFICGGTFAGIEAIVRKRKNEHAKIGFGQPSLEDEKDQENNDRLRSEIETDDLIEFGMIPEFIGRLPVVASLNSLTTDDLSKILMEPKNSIVRQFQALFKVSEVDLVFESQAVHEIAIKAYKKKTGARGLRNIMERLLRSTMFHLDKFRGQSLVITPQMVRGEQPIAAMKSAA